MLVVTQSGVVVNLDCTECIFVESDCTDEDGSYKVVVLGGSGNYLTMGWYNDEKRAEIVLQEIVEKCENQSRNRIHKMPSV